MGYANGKLDNPTYNDLKKGLDTASETVKIDYDESIISLEKLLELYLRVVDQYLKLGVTKLKTLLVGTYTKLVVVTSTKSLEDSLPRLVVTTLPFMIYLLNMN